MPLHAVPTSNTPDALHVCPTLVELLRLRARENPEQVAFTFLVDDSGGADALTFHDLDRRARAVAAHLQSSGLSGTRAVLIFQPGLEFIVAFFGCLYAGVVAVPVDPPRPNRPSQRVHAVLADARAPVVIASTATALRGVQFASDIRFVFTSEVAGDLAGEWREPAIDSDSLAVLQYTSGSTADPKGVMISHSNALHNLAALDVITGGADEPRGLFWLPHYHDMGLVGSVLLSVFGRCSTTLFAPAAFLKSPIRWLQEITRTRATHTAAPNFAYELCVRQSTPEQRRDLDLTSLMVSFNGGETVRHETVSRFVEMFEPCGFRPEAIYPSYGMAETTLLASGKTRREVSPTVTVRASELEQGRVVETSERSRVSRTLVGCGHAPDGHTILVVDTQTSIEALPDRVGEIWISGPSVAGGYWGRDGETAATFEARPAGADAGQFLRTGDLGFLRGDELYVTGRCKDLIVVRGRNLYPQDVEAAVEACDPRLRTGCGAAFAIEGDGEESVAVVYEVERQVRAPEADAIVASIRSAVAEEFDATAAAVVLVRPGGVPRTPSGKVRRGACREALLRSELSIIAEWRLAPRSADAAPEAPARPMTPREIEAWLVERLVQRIGISADDVDPHLPFAYFGIDSVEGVAITRALAAKLGRDLPETLLWDYPTLDAVCRHLGAGE
jgi:acyl-CoA synthetase (AMP-forming)/AMP-acid ligase II/acyl carrier protein